MEGADQRSVGEPNKQLQPTPQSAARFGVPSAPDGRLGAAELRRYVTKPAEAEDLSVDDQNRPI